jgi:hypothetical protein
MSNGGKVNMKVVVLYEIYNFAVNKKNHLRSFVVSHI